MCERGTWTDRHWLDTSCLEIRKDDRDQGTWPNKWIHQMPLLGGSRKIDLWLDPPVVVLSKRTFGCPSLALFTVDGPPEASGTSLINHSPTIPITQWICNMDEEQKDIEICGLKKLTAPCGSAATGPYWWLGKNTPIAKLTMKSRMDDRWCGMVAATSSFPNWVNSIYKSFHHNNIIAQTRLFLNQFLKLSYKWAGVFLPPVFMFLFS